MAVVEIDKAALAIEADTLDIECGRVEPCLAGGIFEIVQRHGIFRVLVATREMEMAAGRDFRHRAIRLSWIELN